MLILIITFEFLLVDQLSLLLIRLKTLDFELLVLFGQFDIIALVAGIVIAVGVEFLVFSFLVLYISNSEVYSLLNAVYSIVSFLESFFY